MEDGVWCVNWSEAMQRVQAMTDVSLWQFVMRAVTIAVRRCSNGQGPQTPIDMVFFVETMVELFAQRETLSRIFAGEDLRWFRD